MSEQIKTPITLNTRIQSKRITYAQAVDTTSTFTPLEGEIVLVRIDSTSNDGTQATKPTYIMKVGDGTTTISNLKWFHAPASDVYAWAKKANIDVADLPVLKLNDAALANVKAAIEGKVSQDTYNTKIGTIEGNISDNSDAITTINQKLANLPDNLNNYVTVSTFNGLSDTVNGHTTSIGTLQTDVTTLKGADNVTGSVAKTVKDAVKVETDRATGIEQGLRSDLGGLSDSFDSFYSLVISGNEDEDGSLLNAVKKSKDYTDTEISNFNTNTITPLTTRVKDLEDNKAGYATTGYVDGEIDKVEQVVANKLDKTTYDTYINGKSLSDAELKNYADSAASGAITTLRGGYTGSLEELDTAYKAADSAIDGRIGNLEKALSNVSNVMDFVGVRTVTISEGVITVTPNSGETFNKGDVVVNSTGKEFVYDGKAWHEFGDTSALSTSVGTLQGKMTTVEGKLTDVTSTVGALIDSKISTNNSTVNSTIEGVAARVKKIEDAPYATTGNVATAKSQVIGTSTDTKESDTVKGAKKYADAAISTLVSSGQVKTNTDNISTLRSEVNALNTFKDTTVSQNYVDKTTYATDKQTLTKADADLDSRIEDIENLKIDDTYATKASLKTVSDDLDIAEGNISTLQGILEDYTTKGSVKAAIGAVDSKAGNAASAAATADGKAVAAQNTANTAVNALGKYNTSKAVENEFTSVNGIIGGIQTNYLKQDNGKLVINGAEIIFDCGTI